MKAIHFICRRNLDGINLNGVSVVEKTPQLIYRTCCWDVSVQDAEALVGGWVYLHPKKTAASEFGGRVLRFEAGQTWEGKSHENRIAFFVQSYTEARGRRWRGADHALAWTGGVVEADFSHEAQNAPA
jgi:hypothetical protein